MNDCSDDSWFFCFSSSLQSARWCLCLIHAAVVLLGLMGAKATVAVDSEVKSPPEGWNNFTIIISLVATISVASTSWFLLFSIVSCICPSCIASISCFAISGSNPGHPSWDWSIYVPPGTFASPPASGSLCPSGRARIRSSSPSLNFFLRKPAMVQDIPDKVIFCNTHHVVVGKLVSPPR